MEDNSTHVSVVAKDEGFAILFRGQMSLIPVKFMRRSEANKLQEVLQWLVNSASRLSIEPDAYRGQKEGK